MEQGRRTWLPVLQHASCWFCRHWPPPTTTHDISVGLVWERGRGVLTADCNAVNADQLRADFVTAGGGLSLRALVDRLGLGGHGFSACRNGEGEDSED